MGMELEGSMEEYIDTGDIEYNDSEVAAHIRDILSKVVQGGDTSDYYDLVGKLSQSGHMTPDDVASLVTSLKGLSGAVASINIVRHESLLQAIFGMNMWKYNPDVMDVLVNLIIRLATSSGEFVDSSLEMLIKNFTPHQSLLENLHKPRGIVKKEQVLDRVHSALINITELVPLAPLRLLPILSQRMPNIFGSERAMAIYVENMLRLESGPIGEFVGSTMLLAVVDRLVELDVEIGWDDITENKSDESESDKNESDKGIFEMEPEDMDGGDYYGLSKPEKVNAVAEKLDYLMELICQHLKSCAENGRLLKVFETLLQSFHVTVLNTQRSKFAQFFMFYACSLDPEECGVSFSIMLTDVFCCNTGIPLTRMSSIAYLASYLSRAKFLEGQIIASTLQRLVNWCVDYCRLVDAEERTLNPQAHRVFYSGCQAIMYVLCFRMGEMLSDSDLKSQIFGFPLQLILKHPLNPLKVCLPLIVEEFLKQAKAASLFTTSENFHFTNLLESDLSKAFGGVERLDMFFPFDPYLLSKSNRFIKPIFRRWSNAANMDADKEGFSAEEQLGEEVDYLSDESDEDMGRSFNDGDDLYPDDFEDSMNKMSITPKSSLKCSMGGEHKIIPKKMPAIIRPSTSPL
ncbi:hypothetical protein MKW94_030111 [Papaver nudicaule]|uniref:RNA polymerase I-specific transcription initiation factor RRN3 n=1 Tax=Papaver nudicaule TaxID=74823 RepID=A0AA41V401_PAPNU|nr:hypothetical protein [Papaver nudicaule]